MTYLGIEIGGTKLQVGLGDGLGALTAMKRVSANSQAGAAGIRQQILEATRELLQETGVTREQLRGCGVGFGGPVNDRTQRTIKSHQVAGWDDFPLVEWVREELGVPAVLGNDADVAGLAEATCGAGRGCDPVFYMNVGSGIGGALILNGRIHRGTGLGAGEIGHLWVDHGFDVEQEEWSILEDRASGWAMQRQSGQPDVPTLLRAMAAGNARARTIWQGARLRIALALTHVIALICPQRIVVGGGVSLAPAELFLEPLRDEVAHKVFPPFKDCYDIQLAALGESVVVQGSLILARQRFPL